MKANLVFFDTIEESKKGFIRSLAAFTVLMIYDFLYYKKINIKLIITWLLLCSAIGVMLPKNTTQAAVLGFLIGTTVYGILQVWLNQNVYLRGTVGVILASVITELVT